MWLGLLTNLLFRNHRPTARKNPRAVLERQFIVWILILDCLPGTSHRSMRSRSDRFHAPNRRAPPDDKQSGTWLKNGIIHK
jgi:hypothetical protein